jgi:hypothetical protein
MFRQSSPRLEREQHDPKRTFVEDSDLPVSVAPDVGLTAKIVERRRKVDAMLRAGKPLRRRWAEPILGRRHATVPVEVQNCHTRLKLPTVTRECFTSSMLF